MRLSFRLYQLFNLVGSFILYEIAIFNPGASQTSRCLMGVLLPMLLTQHALSVRRWGLLNPIAFAVAIVLWSITLLDHGFLRYTKYRAIEIVRWMPHNDVLAMPMMQVSFQRLGHDRHRCVMRRLDSGAFVADIILSQKEARQRYFELIDKYYTGTRYKAVGQAILRGLLFPVRVATSVFKQAPSQEKHKQDKSLQTMKSLAWLYHRLCEPDGWSLLWKALLRCVPAMILISVPVMLVISLM